MKHLFSVLLSVFMVCFVMSGCMTDKEYWLRKQQLENQAKHPTTYDALYMEGPITVELQSGSKVKVTVPNQPFQEVKIPDGIKTQEELIKHLIDVGAITFLGYGALDKAHDAEHKSTTNIYNNGVAE